MIDDPTSSRPEPDVPAGGQRLEAALRAAFPPPPLPEGFQRRLRTALLRDAEVDIEARRAALQARYERERKELQQGQLRLRLHTLALVACLCFAAGALSVLALPWLQRWFGADAGLLMSSLALGLGATVGVGSWAWQAGRLRGLARL